SGTQPSAREKARSAMQATRSGKERASSQTVRRKRRAARTKVRSTPTRGDRASTDSLNYHGGADDGAGDDRRVLADAHEDRRLPLAQKVNPAKVESSYDGASPVLRDREPKSVEGIVGVDPRAVVRTKTRREDDRSKSRQINALGCGRGERARWRQIRRRHAAALAVPPNEQAQIDVARVAERDGCREIVRELEPRRVGADEVPYEVHPEPVQGAVVE